MAPLVFTQIPITKRLPNHPAPRVLSRRAGARLRIAALASEDDMPYELQSFAAASLSAERRLADVRRLLAASQARIALPVDDLELQSADEALREAELRLSAIIAPVVSPARLSTPTAATTLTPPRELPSERLAQLVAHVDGAVAAALRVCASLVSTTSSVLRNAISLYSTAQAKTSASVSATQRMLGQLGVHAANAALAAKSRRLSAVSAIVGLPALLLAVMQPKMGAARERAAAGAQSAAVQLAQTTTVIAERAVAASGRLSAAASAAASPAAAACQGACAAALAAVSALPGARAASAAARSDPGLGASLLLAACLAGARLAGMLSDPPQERLAVLPAAGSGAAAIRGASAGALQPPSKLVLAAHFTRMLHDSVLLGEDAKREMANQPRVLAALNKALASARAAEDVMKRVM
jgi:hypothetical protein